MSQISVSFACDHRGYEAKDQILAYLKQKNYKVVDCGTDSGESVDYPDFMFKAAQKVASGECRFGIGVCYTGIGSAIAANKVKGVRAALVHSVKEAELSRAHNDSNMIILGSGFLDPAQIIPIIDKWLNTSFEGGRHEQRVGKIKTYEQKHGL